MLLLLSLLACDDHIFSSGAGHGGDVESGDAVVLLQSSCSGCHSEALVPKFSGNICDNLVDVVGTQSDMPFVTAGDPANSYLVQKIKGIAEVGGVMPPTGALAESDIATIEQWITDGASCDAISTVDTGDVEDTGTGEDTGETTDMEQSIPDGADVSNGNALVNQHCGICHVDSYAPAFESLVPFIDNAQIASAIQNGTDGGMMAIEAITTEQEVNDIIGFLRTTYPADPNGGNGGNGGEDTGVTEGPDGEELANIHCNNCHVNGYAPTFDTIIPFKDAQEIADILANGSGGMPSFPNLTAEEVDALILFLDATYNQ